MDSSFRLTDRECEILARLVEGDTNEEIANHLNIGAESVKKHISAIGKKLSASNRVRIAVTAVIVGLVRPQFNDLSKYFSLYTPHSHTDTQESNQPTFARFETAYILPPPPPTDRPPWDGLTDGEMRVFRLIEQNNNAIAESLIISIHTVKKHLRHIYQKTACQNREQLANLARIEKETRQYYSKRSD